MLIKNYRSFRILSSIDTYLHQQHNAAMKNYLVETGFSEEDIILEEQSKTTFENLKNVRDMLDVNGVKHHYIFAAIVLLWGMVVAKIYY